MSEASTTVLKFGGYQPQASVHTRAAVVFGNALKERLGDEIDFEFESNIVETGSNAHDLLTRVESGSLSMCYFSASYLADRIPEFALFDLPFMFADRDDAYAALDGPLKAILADRLAQNTGYRLVDFWDNGFRHISNAVRPIRAPQDCKGLMIRTLFSDLHGEVFRQLGFKPVPLDVKDLIARVNAGTLDAQENPLTNIYNFNIHAHHKFITLSAHFFGAAVLLCNAQAYDSWPAHIREAVDRSAAEATMAQRGFASNEDADMLIKLAETDADVIALTPEELGLFQVAVQPVIAAQKARFGDELYSLLHP